jgi:hypothetical protein
MFSREDHKGAKNFNLGRTAVLPCQNKLEWQGVRCRAAQIKSRFCRAPFLIVRRMTTTRLLQLSAEATISKLRRSDIFVARGQRICERNPGNISPNNPEAVCEAAR